jgi:hypothetical protein
MLSVTDHARAHDLCSRSIPATSTLRVKLVKAANFAWIHAGRRDVSTAHCCAPRSGAPLRMTMDGSAIHQPHHVLWIA